MKHPSLQDIDNNAIDGFYIGTGLNPVDESAVNLDLNNDVDKTDFGVNAVVMGFKKNPPELDKSRFDALVKDHPIQPQTP